MLDSTFLKIINAFDVKGCLVESMPMTSGHINTTYRIKTQDKFCVSHLYTLQAINTYVFKKPEELMENIVNVTAHIRKKTEEAGGDTDREVLTVVPTKKRETCYISDSGEYWRLYKYIDRSHTLNFVDDPQQLYSAGFGFGKFQRIMADFPMEKLHETIPNFHNTKLRIDELSRAVKQDLRSRVKFCRKELEFFEEHKKELCLLVDMTNSKEFPLRVTHNDTKFNNILLDDETDNAMCVIDLDTVMPGLLVNDFGDAIRYAANSAAEDETDLSKIELDLFAYSNFTTGFLTALNGNLTDAELKYMPLGAKIITMELAMRFLTDYLNGDIYFKIHKPNHNLDRVRCQIKLAQSMEESFDKMADIINEFYQTSALTI